MAYLYYGLGIIAILVGIILVMGAALPVKHVASRDVILNADMARVWELITNYSDMPKWRKELLKVERVTAANGTEIWQEFENESESFDFETVSQIEGIKLVRKIVGDRTDFGGTWTFALETEGAKTKLTITENGEVYNILFRFVSKFIMGHYSSMNKYISQLEAHIETQ
ncbi:MAG: SRPBCC family protein [Hyphomicrobiales bacterium]